MSGTLTINSNVASLDAQRRVSESTASLEKSYERLSSGLRITDASDDAAGLAVAGSLNSASRVYTVGVRNANDAISFYSIAEGALNSLVTITTRLNELAEQSSNGVLGVSQRKSLDAEAQALGKEYQRIINTTQFNGQNVINSGNGPLKIQLGYSAVSLSGGLAPTGTFASPTTAPTTASHPSSITTADVNGDGNVDLLSSDENTGTVSVFLGNGDGTFQARQSYTSSSGAVSVTSADVNGDGKADLISVGYSSSTVSVLLGNGDGTFRAKLSYATSVNPENEIATDLNGDGKLDLVVSTLASMNVLRGNGDGTFLAAVTYALTGGSFSVSSADLNGDGVTDLVAVSSVFSTVNIFLGNADGSFRANTSFTAGSVLRANVGDFNGDGIVDIVSADSSTSSIDVSIGNGDGTFRAAVSSVAGSFDEGLISGDLNGDGNLDVVAADYSDNTLSVLFGNGDGTFLARTTYATGNGDRSVAAADLNGDGALDLVSSNFGANGLSIFIGNTSAQAVVAPTTGQYSLLSKQSSLQALTQFTKVLDSLTASLGAVGANESRLQFATAVVQETRINYESAASQIQDVDVAAEAANLARNQVLQQAGAAILAQANQQPSLSLKLLQGI